MGASLRDFPDQPIRNWTRSTLILRLSALTALCLAVALLIGGKDTIFAWVIFTLALIALASLHFMPSLTDFAFISALIAIPAVPLLLLRLVPLSTEPIFVWG